MAPIKVLFVCLGNICRSPTAHGIFENRLAQAGLASWVKVDSAGTAAYHVGKGPDPRTVAAAAERGYDLSPLRARQVADVDFQKYDWILAMDAQNLADLEHRCPPEYRHKLHLFLDFARNSEVREVPDPYYGGADGFEYVLNLVEDASDGLIERLRSGLE